MKFKFTKEFKKELIESLITLAIGMTAVVAVALFLSFITNKFGDEKTTQLEKIQSNTETIRRITVPYEYKNELNKITLIKDFSNTAIANQQSDSFEKSLKTTGTFEDGYLYIKASVDGKSLTPNDGVYIKISTTTGGLYQQYGGHLIKPKSLDVPKSEDFTELLYELSDVKYKLNYKLSDVEVQSADWLKILNETNNQVVVGFSSTERRGVIVEANLYYKCLKGSGCSIE